MHNAQNDILSFKSYQFQLKAAFPVYADFECFVSKMKVCSPDPNMSSSTATHKHVPPGFCYIYSNKKETSDFHGTVSFDPVKMLQQK